MSFPESQVRIGNDVRKATVTPVHRSSVYGTYLCKEIPIEYLSEDSNDDIQSCVKALRRSAEYFSKRKQKRNCERLQFDMAKEYMRGGYWEDARRLLLPLWQHLSWRQAGWWHLLRAVDQALNQCARYCNDRWTLVATQWELLNSALATTLDVPPDNPGYLEAMANLRSKPRIVLAADSYLSPLSTTFAFGFTEGHVGEPLACQLVISSRAQRLSKPIVISHVTLTFGGGLLDVHIRHAVAKGPTASTSDGSICFSEVSLHRLSDSVEGSHLLSSTSSPNIGALSGECELTMEPLTSKIILFYVLPRDAGEISLTSVAVYVVEHTFDLEFITSHVAHFTPKNWWIRSEAGLSKKTQGRGLIQVATILPKLSKMRIILVDILKTYFADEHVSITVQLENGEEEDANVTLAVRLLGPAGTMLGLNWGPGFTCAQMKGTGSREPTNHIFSERPCKLVAAETLKQTIEFQAKSEASQYVLEVKALYNLSTEPDTPLSKTFATDINVTRPLNAICAFSPRPHAGRWPSYFGIIEAANNEKVDSEADKKPTGIVQAWLLTAIINSRVSEYLEVEEFTVRTINVHNDDTCTTTLEVHSITRAVVLTSPDEVHKVHFEIKVHGHGLDDLRLTVVELELAIKWRRQGSDAPSTFTTFAVPKLSISLSEPRVLAAAFNELGSPGLIHIDYTIENPSMHLLNFDLNMASSEDFVFSGAKATQLQLIPFSRRTVRYSLLSLNQGIWISPHLSVKDIHFSKILEPYPTDGMRLDKKGISAWVDSDG